MEERNVTMIITFECLTEKEASKILEEYKEIEDILKEEAPGVKIKIERGASINGCAVPE